MSTTQLSGRTIALPSYLETRLIARARVHRGCWLYVAPRAGRHVKFPYPRIGWGVDGIGYLLGVHELSARLWLLSGGEIKDDHHVHHTCGNEGCFNPWHLDVVWRPNHQDLHYQQRLRLRDERSRIIEARARAAYGDNFLRVVE